MNPRTRTQRRSWTRLTPWLALVVLGAGGLGWLLSTGGTDRGVPEYTVLNRMTIGDGDTADVLVRSAIDESDRRESIFRTIIEAEELREAYFFSTEAAVEAHQAFLPSPTQLQALRTGFLGEVRNDRFTPGEALYPDAGTGTDSDGAIDE